MNQIQYWAKLLSESSDNISNDEIKIKDDIEKKLNEDDKGIADFMSDMKNKYPDLFNYAMDIKHKYPKLFDFAMSKLKGKV